MNDATRREILDCLVSGHEVIEPFDDQTTLEETRIALTVTFFEVLLEAQLLRSEKSVCYVPMNENSALEYPFLRATAQFLRNAGGNTNGGAVKATNKEKWLRMLRGEEA